jgi:hypothetical protein
MTDGRFPTKSVSRVRINYNYFTNLDCTPRGAGLWGCVGFEKIVNRL